MNLDIFNGDAFHIIPLSQAFTLLPYTPTRIRQLGLFAEEGISTLSVMVEMDNDVLSLVPTAPRGSSGQVVTIGRRNVRPFMSVHLPQRYSLTADEVQGLRAFGSMTEVETATNRLMKKGAKARRDLDLTIEYQRMGAIKGKVLDADGTTIISNLYTEFGVTQQTLDCHLDVTTTHVFNVLGPVLKRLIEDKLGGIMMSGIRVLCSGEYFDAVTTHPVVEESYKYQAAQVNRDDKRRGFEIVPGVVLEEYRGQVGAIRFIEAGCAYAMPEGVPDLFTTYYSPADNMDTVNTDGLPYYMSVEPMDHGKGVDVLTQSNPLHLCNRPNAIVKLGVNAAALA